MKRVLISLLAILFPVCAFGNIMPPVSLPAGDYFRGTTGERLFFNYREVRSGVLSISSDLRYCDFGGYWNYFGEKREYDTDNYKRVINITSLGYAVTDRVLVGLRLPYVTRETTWGSNSGFSDIFLSVSYLVSRSSDSQIFLSSGLKLPTGDHEDGDGKLPLGTGSRDVPVILSLDFELQHFSLFSDMGYIFTGESDAEEAWSGQERRRDNGNEVFADLAVMKRFSPAAAKLEIDYYHVATSWDDVLGREEGQYKLSIVPGIVLPQILENLTIEVGFSHDVAGENTFRDTSPVVRVHYGR
jgi:hypothetical protein